jgi:mRNA interferase RelE/StbE
LFRIFETSEFTKQINALQPSEQRVIEGKLKRQIYPHLKQTPYFGPQIRKLRNYHPETWRIRIGDYRLFYAINDKQKIVKMFSIDKRKDAYRD